MGRGDRDGAEGRRGVGDLQPCGVWTRRNLKLTNKEVSAMKINRSTPCRKPTLTLRDLKPGDAFEKVCNNPQAVYVVGDYVTNQTSHYAAMRERERKYDSYRAQGIYPVFDLTNNRALPVEYMAPTTEVRKLDVELCVKGTLEG
jgi:hypothetical protein